MNYKQFLQIINTSNFNKKVYDKLIKTHGSELINSYFSTYIDSNLTEEAYDKCKYYLEDELNKLSYDCECYNYNNLDGLKIYLNQVDQHRLLKPEEERLILIKLNNIKEFINDYNKKYNIKELLNNDNIEGEKRKIIKEYLKKEKEYVLLSNKLTEANLRLVFSIAKHYENLGVELLDLIQEGNIGVREAIDKFDISKGKKFSTYATWWIKKYIVSEIYKNSRIIKLPVYKHELFFKIKKISSWYEKENSKLPSNEELIEFIKNKIEEGTLKNTTILEDITPELVEKIKKVTQSVVSINNKIGDNITLEDLIADFNQDEILEKKALPDYISSILKDVSYRHKLVIILRFGLSLNNYMKYSEFLKCFKKLIYDEVYYKKLYIKLCQAPRIYTLGEIGSIYNVTDEAIRQLEAKTLSLLKTNIIE